MELNDIINLIVNNGSSVALLLYFIYKDNKFTSNLEILMTTIKNSVDSLKELIERSEK